MKNLNRKSAMPPFKKTCPAPYFHTLFLIVQILPPSGGSNQNLLSPFKKRGGRSDLCSIKQYHETSFIYVFEAKCNQLRLNTI